VVEVPALVLADAVQGREVAALQQVVDGRREGPVAVEACRQVGAGDRLAAAVGLAIPAALGVAGQGQVVDPFSRRRHGKFSIAGVCSSSLSRTAFPPARAAMSILLLVLLADTPAKPDSKALIQAARPV